VGSKQKRGKNNKEEKRGRGRKKKNYGREKIEEMMEVGRHFVEDGGEMGEARRGKQNFERAKRRKRK
jgi:hypothetical protein